MTLKEMQEKIQRTQSKLTVAQSMKARMINFLWDYYDIQRDEEGNELHDEDYNRIIDFTKVTCWNEELAPLAKELTDELEKTMMKWIEK